MRRRKFLLCGAGTSLATTLGYQPATALQPGSAGDVLYNDIAITVGSRVVKARLASPPAARMAPKPLLLLSLCSDRETALTVAPFSIGAEAFLARGHRAVGLDLPDHGERVGAYGEGIRAWRNAWVDGHDRFRMFLEEAGALIGHCLQAGLAEPGRVVVYGISRGGYLALRLLAEDQRVAGAAAIAPVTDWRNLDEFSADRDRKDLEATSLSHQADALAGKRVFLVIGTSDHRVSTRSCCRFFVDLLEASARRNLLSPPVEFHCVGMAEPGHAVDDSWRRRGAEFLI
jgi:pimeloyl-ACP methyl ester carboxylesterase